MEKKKFRLNAHLVIALLIIVILFLIVRKFIGFGRYISKDEIDAISVPENAGMQTYDNIISLRAEDDGTFPEDDGVMTVLCLGNAPFADDKDSPDNPCNLFAEATGATVYNCAIADSYMTSLNTILQNGDNPMDTFSFYWLTTIFATDNYRIAEYAFGDLEPVSNDLRESIKTLQNLDFRTVDVIYIMYDGSDYLEGRPVYNINNSTDIQTFSGAMEAGIQLIQQYYPWIRIVVMSPTYAFGVEEDGSYISSDIKVYGDYKLSAYVIEQSFTTESLEVSFVDCFYGGIHEDIASDYLIDNIHLNAAGRALVAKRMEEALQKSLPQQP